MTTAAAVTDLWVATDGAPSFPDYLPADGTAAPRRGPRPSVVPIWRS